MNDRVLGRVKWYDESRGYGFITADDGRDIFVHWKGIAYQGANRRRRLSVGERVKFRIVQARAGAEARAVAPERE